MYQKSMDHSHIFPRMNEREKMTCLVCVISQRNKHRPYVAISEKKIKDGRREMTVSFVQH